MGPGHKCRRNFADLSNRDVWDGALPGFSDDLNFENYRECQRLHVLRRMSLKPSADGFARRILPLPFQDAEDLEVDEVIVEPLCFSLCAFTTES